MRVTAGLILLLILPWSESKAQFYSIKTNVLELAALGTLNADLSMMIAPRWTANLDLAYNPWTYPDNRKLKHWIVEPGVRYWFWQTYIGGFVSTSAMATQFNVGLNQKRHEGFGFGLNAAYGYSWLLSKRWNVEAEAGVGLLWNKRTIYKCDKCGDLLTPKKSYLSPTPKLSVSLIYLL